MTLRDALEMWNRGEIVVEVSPGRWQAIHKATDALIGAARRVAEAPEVKYWNDVWYDYVVVLDENGEWTQTKLPEGRYRMVRIDDD